MKMTKHATVDRLSRLEYIIDTIGIGETVCTAKQIDSLNRIGYSSLTSTGVIVITSENHKLVTAYIAEMNQAIKVWRDAKGNGIKLPQYLFNKIKNNDNVRKLQPC